MVLGRSISGMSLLGGMKRSFGGWAWVGVGRWRSAVEMGRGRGSRVAAHVLRCWHGAAEREAKGRDLMLRVASGREGSAKEWAWTAWRISVEDERRRRSGIVHVCRDLVRKGTSRAHVRAWRLVMLSGGMGRSFGVRCVLAGWRRRAWASSAAGMKAKVKCRREAKVAVMGWRLWVRSRRYREKAQKAMCFRQMRRMAAKIVAFWIAWARWRSYGRGVEGVGSRRRRESMVRGSMREFTLSCVYDFNEGSRDCIRCAASSVQGSMRQSHHVTQLHFVGLVADKPRYQT
jgi:hypothetical protein